MRERGDVTRFGRGVRAGTRRAAAVLAAAGLVILGGGLISGMVQPTSAAWTDPASVTAAATSGSWSSVPVNSCQVRNANGTVDASKTCTVQPPAPSYWLDGGTGKGNMSVTVSTGSIDVTQYFTFSLTIPAAPAWWAWTSAGVTSTNGFGTITSACSQLPVLAGHSNPNLGPTVNVFVSFVEVRGTTPVLCGT